MLGSVRTDDFAFDLPLGQVAQQPAEPRDSARLMVLRFRSGVVEHRTVRDLPALLKPGDLLVVNDTRVMAARLFGRRPDTGGEVEALLVRPFSDRLWEVLFKPTRQARPGRRFIFEASDGPLAATVQFRAEGPVVLEFERSFDPASAGTIPLPPYIKDYTGDPERYQTVYNQVPGSAAAPTAGLHFTRELLRRLGDAGIQRAEITLHVGLDTFAPVTEADPGTHQIHREWCELSAETAEPVSYTHLTLPTIYSV